MHRRVPDISKIGALVNFRPSRNTEEIVASVVDYFRAQAESRHIDELPWAPIRNPVRPQLTLRSSRAFN
jgi:hypothetical protein